MRSVPCLYRVFLLQVVPLVPLLAGNLFNPDYTIRNWEEVESLPFSSVARQVLDPDKGSWHVGESTHFFAFASTLRDVQRLIDEAEYVLAKAGDLFGLDPDRSEKARIYLVDDDGVWSRAMKQGRIRPDSIAVHADHELFLKNDPAQGKKVERVAHEVIHLLFAARFNGALPLWLDEGVANYFGWRFAESYRMGTSVLVRSLPALSPKVLFDINDLSLMRKYPDDEEVLTGFYRQSEAIVVCLLEQMDARALASFIRRFNEAKLPLGAFMQREYGMREHEWMDFQRRVREYCLTEIRQD